MIEWFKSIGALGELFAKIGALVIKGQPTASFTVRKAHESSDASAL
jgi:hypothetical protein